MDFIQWEPIYHCILADFGFSEADDEQAALILAQLCAEKDIINPFSLHLKKEVTVCGCALTLETEIEAYGLHGTIIAADGAASRLPMRPELIVTDLDGDIPSEINYNNLGSIAAIHAHGDNIGALKEHLPFFNGPIIPTVQCKPVKGTYNFGGFTDGDRAVIMAHSMGAEKIHLRGFDFTQPFPKPGKDLNMKKKKLMWAEKIISSLNIDLLIP